MKRVPGLSVTRKEGEKVVLGRNGEVVLTVLSIHRGKVRIGVEAPNSVSVKRLETKLEQEGRDQ